MTLKLYMHPLASYCWKVLLALYENETPFESITVDLGDPAQRAELERHWTFAKFPLLRDEARGQTIAESTIIIEYLAQHHPGRVALIPDDRDAARAVRFEDRFFDLYVHHPMQSIVGDRLRPAGAKDPLGVDTARATLRTAYTRLERELGQRHFAAGDTFSMADCAAGPALYYGNRVAPLGADFPGTAAYLERLLERASFQRVLREAEPYFAMFPEA
jgi:glutathione S-transferase